MQSIKRLDWDSAFFGYEIGAIHIGSNEQFDVSWFTQNKLEFKVVYIFSAELLPETPILKLVDKKVTYHKYLKDDIATIYRHPEKKKPFIISRFDANLHAYSKLLSLALQSGVYSRFRIDTNFINDEYTRLYSEWLTESVNKRLAFETLVACQRSELQGFITLSKKNVNLADIGLIAVDHRERGKGVASALIQRAMQEAISKEFSEIQVVTQLDNQPANQLYRKLGFNLQNIIYIYHYWHYDSI